MKGLVAETGEVLDIGPAHPVADLFPMLAGEDFEELVTSIQEQGLLQPIVVDAEGRVLDGRNRLAACERLGATPEVIVYVGDDPDGYALTVNLARRHLTKGQQAAVAAEALFLRNSRQEAIAQASGLSQASIAKAAVVFTYGQEDLHPAVKRGAMPLNEAYAAAQDRKKADADEAAQMARLQDEAPDLADLVAEERMPLAEAMAAYRSRVERFRDQRRRFTTSVAQALVSVWAQLDPDPSKAVETLWDPEVNTYAGTQPERFTPAGLRDSAVLLVRLADHLEEKGAASL